MITLRHDQMEAVENLRAELRNNQSVLLRGPCGFGKTVVSAYMAAGSDRKNKRVIFGVHRRELARQTAATFAKFGINYGLIMAGYPQNPLANVQIASADTLRRRPVLLKCDMFIPDETHLWGTGVREEIIHTVYKDGSYIVPLTATPARGDGKGLGIIKDGAGKIISGIADAIVQGPSEAWLIEQGFLAKYRAYAPVQMDMTGIRTRVSFGEKEHSTADLEEKFDKPKIIGEAVANYRKFAYGRRMIGYCFSRKHGDHMAETFTASGIPSAYIDGETPDAERRKVIMAFATGSIMCLFNVALFREGFDLSAQVGMDVPIQAVGLYNPSKSLPLAIQMMMRGMRPQVGHTIILDHANILRDHGLPDDEREWPLEADPKKSKKGGHVTATVTCGDCFATFRPTQPKCPYCDCVRDIEGRQIVVVDGELEEIDPDLVRQARAEEQKAINRRVQQTRGLPDLARLAVELGRPANWVYQTYKHRPDGRKDIPYAEIVRAMAKAKLEMEKTA